MIGRRPSYFWMLCWKYLGPIAMIVILAASLIEIFSKGTSYEIWNPNKWSPNKVSIGHKRYGTQINGAAIKWE